MELNEELAYMFMNMAASYESHFIASGKKHVGGAFLNGYETAIRNIYEELTKNPTFLWRMQENLETQIKAFEYMAKMSGADVKSI